MRNRIFPILLLIGLLLATTVVHAQDKATKANGKKAEATSRVDLKPRTLVSKKLDSVKDGPNGKVYTYKYRVEAQPTESDMPRYAVDPQYNVSYKQEGFLEGDKVTLISSNPETATDSPIWNYEISYEGSGERSITFDTTASVMAATFAAAGGETDPEDPNYHCRTCGHYDVSQCTAACRCCCSSGDENCNCLGCQYQNPRCFGCPVGCTCDHCICSCDGCLTQNPRCLGCPVGCTCDHCRCQCEESIDHSGRCGCAVCKQRPSVCDCECHKNCP